VLSADSTQQAQMLYRIRRTKTCEIVVSIQMDKLSTFTDKVTNDTSILEDDNFNTLTRSNQTDENAVYRTEPHKVQKLTTLNKNDSLSKRLNQFKNYGVLTQEKVFVYELFKKAYQWGSKDLQCEYFDSITESIYLDEETDIIPVTTYSLSCLEEEAFYNAKYLKNIPKVEDIDNKERNLDIHKTYGYINLGISREIYDRELFDSRYRIVMTQLIYPLYKDIHIIQ